MNTFGACFSSSHLPVPVSRSFLQSNISREAARATTGFGSCKNHGIYFHPMSSHILGCQACIPLEIYNESQAFSGYRAMSGHENSIWENVEHCTHSGFIVTLEPWLGERSGGNVQNTLGAQPA